MVYFDFDRYEVKAEYQPRIKEIVAWMASHKACHLQVEGHTCRIGSFAYNAALGRNRAKAVYDAMRTAGVPGEQVAQFVSLSKDRAASEHLPKNRRVILRIIGPASEK